MKAPYLIFALLLYSFTSSAQSIQIGYYTGASIFSNERLFSGQSLGGNHKDWSNDINIRWIPPGKLNRFSVALGFGYYKPRGGEYYNTEIDYNTYIIYNEFLRDKIQDYEYNLILQYRLFRSKNKRIDINIGGSVTYFPEKVSRYYKAYNQKDTAQVYSGNVWEKFNFLYFGIHTEISYKVTTWLSANARAAFRTELWYLDFNSQGTPYLFYDAIPNSYWNLQLGLNYIFKY